MRRDDIKPSKPTRAVGHRLDGSRLLTPNIPTRLFHDCADEFGDRYRGIGFMRDNQ
jgi:hypothetical protein